MRPIVSTDNVCVKVNKSPIKHIGDLIEKHLKKFRADIHRLDVLNFVR